MGRNSWMQTPADYEIMDGKFHAADGLAIVFNPSFPYRLVRGVAFDYRVKARDADKAAWNHLFAAGSLVTALAQGWILGAYVTGFYTDLWSRLLAAGIALTLPAAYAMLGVGWLLMKTEGDLQRKALRWGQGVLWPMGFALMGISLATPVVSQTVFNQWFVLPAFFALLPISLACVAAFFAIRPGRTACGGRRLWVDCVCGDGGHFCAGLLRAGVQHLPLHRDGSPDGVGGRQRHRVADRDRDRRRHRHRHRRGHHAAGDRGLHRVHVPRVGARHGGWCTGCEDSHPIGCQRLSLLRQQLLD